MSSLGSKPEANEGSEVISLTVDQLEDIIDAAVPPLSQTLGALANARDPGAAALIEWCTPCVAGYKVCVKCSFFGCKTRVRRC